VKTAGHFFTELFTFFSLFTVIEIMPVFILCEVIYSALTSCFLQCNFIIFIVHLGVFGNVISIYVKVGRGSRLFCSQKHPNQMEPHQPPTKLVPGVLSPVVGG
jgi:hypothetical protein